MHIDTDTGTTTVIVSFRTARVEQDELTRLIRASLPLFEKQPGFIAGALHSRTDGRQLLLYLQWISLQAHHDGMTSPDWAEPAAERLLSFIARENVLMETHVYTVHAVAKGTAQRSYEANDT